MNTTKYVGGGGGKKRKHTRIAEWALGRQLPAGVEVHHVNEDKSDNRPENLVICPNHEYHHLLHVRQRAQDACGDANKRCCKFCKKWDSVNNLEGDQRTGIYHRLCNIAYCKAYKLQRHSRRVKETNNAIPGIN